MPSVDTAWQFFQLAPVEQIPLRSQWVTGEEEPDRRRDDIQGQREEKEITKPTPLLCRSSS